MAYYEQPEQQQQLEQPTHSIIPPAASLTATPSSVVRAARPVSGKQHGLGINVLEAARRRIAYVFDNVPRIYVSFSAGKDSTVMLHLVMEEAIKRGRKVGLLLVDLEAQYRLTIEHAERLVEMYRDHLDVYWVALPIHLRNAVSQFEPQWIAWEPSRQADWVRQPPALAITDPKFFPFYEYAMEFEEFVPLFGHWYGGGKLTACFVGIRTDESLNRWRTIMAGKKQSLDGHNWTTWLGQHLYNAYPLYDWQTRDIWIYQAKNPNKPYNQLYDRMYQAGLTVHQMRICQPYGDDQRKGLHLFHVIEPDTWTKVVARVCGANQGALYAQETGNVLGNGKVSKPEGHTYKSFARMLLTSMPDKTREHYENKVAVFLKWWADRGYADSIPDEGSPELKEQYPRNGGPSWERICKMLLRNDYWAHGLSFSQHKTGAYEKYLKVMKKRRKQWGGYIEF